MNIKLHERLVATQTTNELKRKCNKAKQKGLWTQEEIDYIKRTALELYNSVCDGEDMIKKDAK